MSRFMKCLLKEIRLDLSKGISKGKDKGRRDRKDKEIKKLSDRVADEQEKVEILKKSLHIFMQPRE